MNRILTEDLIKAYQRKLEDEEKAKLTVQKYIRDIQKFYRFLPDKKNITRERILSYKQYLKENYCVSSANSMLVALNLFLEYGGWGELRVRQFKIQRQFFCREDRFLSKSEYKRIVSAAEKKGDVQLSLILQTICSTGISLQIKSQG
mgnify:CR=1 FL=1